MSEKEEKKYTVLYIGGTPELIQVFTSRADLFTVHIEGNGLSAISKLKSENDIDAIISEVNLPGINGLDIRQMLKSRSIHDGTPFILFSKEPNPQLKEKAFKVRVDDFYEGIPDSTNIYFRISFLKNFKKDFLPKSTTTTKPRDYRVPWDKRLFDIVVSSTALLLLSPIMLIAMLAIRLESKGKVYYTSKRVGTGYRIFDFYKFRSMRTGADAMLKDLKHLNQYEAEEIVKEDAKPCPRCADMPDGEFCSPILISEGKEICEYWYHDIKKVSGSAFIKIKDDPRITKVGKFIRNTSIDELPQLINVLKGDMSIVGNRPLPLYEAEMLTSDDWIERFLGPAGITGLWQVEKRGRGGKMSEEERKALDNQYARTYSFWGDIKLILRTIPAVFQKENV